MSDKILRISYPLEAYTALVRERDELRERLAAAERSAREMHIAADQFLRERDELRAENERLDQLYGSAMDSLNKVDAENERLRAQVDNCQANAHYRAWQQAQAEVERLRINLRDYRQKHRCSHEIMCWADEIASKALDRTKEC